MSEFLRFWGDCYKSETKPQLGYGSKGEALTTIVSSPTTISSKRTLPTLWFFIVYRLGLGSPGIVTWFDWFKLILDIDRFSLNYIMLRDRADYMPLS